MKHPAPLPPPVEFLERNAACEQTGKARYSSQHAALKTRGKRRNKGRRMHAYRCEHCGGWHLSSQGVIRDEFKRRKT